jgi:hypothetical protein
MQSIGRPNYGPDILNLALDSTSGLGNRSSGQRRVGGALSAEEVRGESEDIVAILEKMRGDGFSEFVF